MLLLMPRESQKARKTTRPPRIRVPNNERALFIINTQKYVGVIQRLSLTGGSVILSKGPDPARIAGRHGLEHSVWESEGADPIPAAAGSSTGIPLAQAFRFIDMDDVSRERFSAAAAQMQSAGFSDVGERKRFRQPDNSKRE